MSFTSTNIASFSAIPSSVSSSPPNQTIYISNLPTKMPKTTLKLQLFVLFSQYGQILDIVAMKTPKMRGQAFIVYKELASAVAAQRHMQGRPLGDLKHTMKIEYAKTKSKAMIEFEKHVIEPIRRQFSMQRKNTWQEGQKDGGDVTNSTLAISDNSLNTIASIVQVPGGQYFIPKMSTTQREDHTVITNPILRGTRATQQISVEMTLQQEQLFVAEQKSQMDIKKVENSIKTKPLSSSFAPPRKSHRGTK